MIVFAGPVQVLVAVVWDVVLVGVVVVVLVVVESGKYCIGRK